MVSPAHPVRLGVVVPLHDGAHWIERTLRTVLVASSDDVSVVVVDDGSTDGSGQLVQALDLPGVTLVSQDNAGVAAARNRGLACLPPHVGACLFLDQDDELVPGALDELARGLEDPGVVAAVGVPEFIDELGLRLAAQPPDLLAGRHRLEGRHLRAVVPGADLDASTLAYRNCVYTPGQVLVRRAALDRCGAFAAATAPADDWDLYLRLVQAGAVVLRSGTTTRVRRHGANVSSDEQVMRTAEIIVRRRHARRSARPDRRAAARSYRASERASALEWWAGARAPGPFRAQQAGRAALCLLWSVLGLEAHWLLRRAAGRHVDPRLRQSGARRWSSTARRVASR